ncbi:unnamed protein product, partial [Nippostrongylus brasiliensis]|uniref:Transmembrane protein n=1 Tax=Nippostrongylus brasiliensis TaxID=27835 RepID=A0A0N4YMG6_NIPBR
MAEEYDDDFQYNSDSGSELGDEVCWFIGLVSLPICKALFVRPFFPPFEITYVVNLFDS